MKSCVGSTWCRYGVQDSRRPRDRPRAALPGPALAAQDQGRRLRLRARVRRGARQGLRRDRHREGLEPLRRRQRRRDPGHAQLLAGDLDNETLVRYLDRFLMYYIRTADRLQRTAPWLDSLDGGLDRVREVVIDDALGLGAELEAAMARHVDTYFDEWAATLDDPEKLARFVSFVNAPDTPDPNITFGEERGQIRPADRRARSRSGPPSRWVPRERGAGVAPAVRDRGVPAVQIEVEGGVAALVAARRWRSSGPTTTRCSRCPTTTRSRGRRCWPGGSSGPGSTA